MNADDLQHPATRGSAEKGSPLIEARRSDGRTVGSGDFTYTVLVDRPPETASSSERRGAARRRTRLRSAKIVDAAGRFVTECLVHDLSAQGGRLRLPSGTSIPPVIRVYDDQTGLLHPATVLWRRERDVGVAFQAASEDARSRQIAAEMRRKFYAVRG